MRIHNMVKTLGFFGLFHFSLAFATSRCVVRVRGIRSLPATHLSLADAKTETPHVKVELPNGQKKPVHLLDGDGKVDAQELACLASYAKSYLDVNGDGKIHLKVGKAVLSIILMTWLLSASPAYAKGGRSGEGGGGGGGGGSSRGSGASSSRRHTSSLEDRIATPLFAFGVGVLAVQDFLDKQRDREFDDDFDSSDIDTSLAASASKKPLSGFYAGRTFENDGITQSVRANLKFYKNGRIVGGGKDSEDGRYKVRGEWKRILVRWEETYNIFSVTVRGEILADGSINCRFHSSRNVRGSFKIKKKF
jgi:hypothetical protein